MKKIIELLKNMNKFEIIKAIIFFVVGLALGFSLKSCQIIKHYPEDNIVEEMVEEVIKGKTGIGIDLTPSTKEK